MPSSLPAENITPAHLPVLEKQLERMRAMHYGYYVQFFQATHLFTVLLLANLALSLIAPFRAAIFVLPFFVVYAGFFTSYLLTYNIFARIYATALEQKINQLTGARLLVAHEMEAVYFYRAPGLKFSAFDLKQPWVFISASTFSFTFGGVVLYALAAYRAQQLLPLLTPKFPPLSLFWPLLAVWTLGHLAYLLWFFVGGKPERELARIVNEAYGTGE